MKVIKFKHPKTKKIYTYFIRDERFIKEHKKELEERAEYDYRKTLTPEQRAKTSNVNTKFNCPYCKKETQYSIRKETITTGFLFFIQTKVINIHKCSECNKEFTNEELELEIEFAKRENDYILLGERINQELYDNKPDKELRIKRLEDNYQNK